MFPPSEKSDQYQENVEDSDPSNDLQDPVNKNARGPKLSEKAAQEL